MSRVVGVRWTALVLLALGCSSHDGQSDLATHIAGTVSDARTGAALAGVLIRTEPVTTEAETDSAGRYVLRDGPRIGRRYQVLAERSGYRAAQAALTTGVREANEVDFALEPVTACIAGAVRCAAGTADQAVERCRDDGLAWERTPCSAGEVCAREPPECRPSFILQAIIDAPGGIVRSLPVEGQTEAVINCGTACEARFVATTTVTLVATPLAGAAFAGWRGACEGLDPMCAVDMRSDRVVGAAFEATAYPVTVDLRGRAEGRVTSDPPGIDCPGRCVALFARDSSVSLTAEPAESAQLDVWQRDCVGTSGSTCILTVDAPKNVRVRFAERAYVLAVSKVGTGAGVVTSAPAGIDCGSACAADFVAGTTVELTASAASASTFEGFSDACVGLDPVCAVTMDAAASVTVRFDGVAHPVSVTVAGDGAGTVTSDPAGVSCPPDCSESFAPATSLELVAAPATGSEFSGWGGDCAAAGSSLTCGLATDGPRSVSATFDRIPFYLLPLAADGSCLLLLRFDPPNVLAPGCGGVDATMVGYATIPSRTPALVEALSAQGPTEEGYIDTRRLGPLAVEATVEMTVRKAGPAFGARGRGVLFSDGDRLAADAGLSLAVVDDGRLVLTSRSAGGTTTATATASIVDGVWTHVAVTVSAGQGVRFFIDGVAAGEHSGALAWTASSSTAWVGAEREGAAGAAERFNGSIDEVRVSNELRY